MKINLTKFIASLTLAFLPGWVGSYITFPKIQTWYQTLQKPDFNPPNFVFGPVWTTLYILMGISLYIIWNKKVSGKSMQLKRVAIKIFSLQLVLNGVWSIIFFGFEQIYMGFIMICVLWVVILFSVTYFYRLSKPAGYLLIPYILWVTFAAILNFTILTLN